MQHETGGGVGPAVHTPEDPSHLLPTWHCVEGGQREVSWQTGVPPLLFCTQSACTILGRLAATSVRRTTIRNVMGARRITRRECRGQTRRSRIRLAVFR